LAVREATPMSGTERFRQLAPQTRAALRRTRDRLTGRQPSDGAEQTLARNQLGVPAVVFFGVAGAAPLTVILGAVSTIYAVVGNRSVPIVYFVAAGILSLFTVGFVAMSRHIVSTGAFYTYISHGLGRIPGVGAAFIALVAYSVMQIGLFGLFGVIAEGILAELGIATSWFVCALVAWIAVAVLGLLKVDLNGKVLAVLLTAEFAIVVVYDLVMIANPADGLSVTTLNPAGIFTAEAAAMLVLAIAGFVGFEATVVLSEEAKDPKHTIARATHWAVLLPGIFIGLSAWAMSVGAGAGAIIERAKQEETDLVFSLVSPHVPEFFISLGYIFFMTSVFAALLAFHAAIARYQFALGREGVLPKLWSRTHPRTAAPVAGSLTQSAVALVVLIIYAAAGIDPLVHLFAWLTTAGGLGVLILMWAACGAVIMFFRHRPGLEHPWRARLAPSIAFVLLTLVLAATAIGLGDLLQVAGDSVFQWLFQVLYLVVAALGVGWALFLRRNRPDVYSAIGHRGQEVADDPAVPVS
jgi:amino acid transporter